MRVSQYAHNNNKGIYYSDERSTHTCKIHCCHSICRSLLGLVFVHMQKDESSKEFMNAKVEFEMHAKMHGVQIPVYHAENDRFADNDFVNNAISQRQQVSYCGVNAHDQIGRAGKRIRNLKDQARDLIMQAVLSGQMPSHHICFHMHKNVK